MQDDDENGRTSITVRQFIRYANKAIQYGIRNFDRGTERRCAREFLPGDGDLCDAPSMQEILETCRDTEAVIFMRSDGKGEPMLIHRVDLAMAIEELAPLEQDFLIRIFQEELPVALYAEEAGISTSMAYRRMRSVLDKLWQSIKRRLDDDECKKGSAEGGNPQMGKKVHEKAGRVHRARYHRGTKR